MGITDEEFHAATTRGDEVRRNGYAVRAKYDEGEKRIVVDLNTGVTITVPIHLIEDLSDADADLLREIEVTPAGLGLHWPRLDADVYVPALMQGVFGTKRWMAAQLGASGGRASTTAKAAASRANGAKGGRPKKQA